MKGQKNLMIATAVAGLAIIASACSIDVERNPDGSLQAVGTISESSLESEMERDPMNESVELDFQAGGIIVASVERREGAAVNTVDFTAEVGSEDGQLVAAVTEASFDGFPIPQEWLDAWNDELTRGLRQAAGEHPGATLENLTVDGDSMTFDWRFETDESRGN